MNTIEFQYKLISLQENLLRFAYKLTTDKEDAKDLVQDTFLKALKYCDKFTNESNIKAWTFTIMKNTFINNYRRSLNHNTYSDQTKEGFYVNYAYASGSFYPESVYISKELEKTIDSLHDDFKLPIKMLHEGFKYKEIAETLDMRLGTVKSRIFFTRKKLKKYLNG